MTKNVGLALGTVLATLEEREKLDKLVCLASGAFVPFAAGVVFSDSFAAQVDTVRFIYVCHLSLVVATATTAFLCLRWVHLARGLMRLEAVLEGYGLKTPSEQVAALLRSAEVCTRPARYARHTYEVLGAGALILGLASYVFGALL